MTIDLKYTCDLSVRGRERGRREGGDVQDEPKSVRCRCDWVAVTGPVSSLGVAPLSGSEKRTQINHYTRLLYDRAVK
jgi:hypothetical protein